MVKAWWNKQTGINQVCGLEIILAANNEIQAQLCTLKLDNNAVSVVQQSSHSDLKSLQEKLKSNKAALAINFSGEGLINRIIPIPSSGSAVDVAFPGIDKEKFYIQEVHQSNHVVVSLINRKIIDSILAQFKNRLVINISLGGFVLCLLRKQTDQRTAHFNFGPHHLIFDEAEEVVTYEFKKEESQDKDIRFEGIKVKGVYLNAFAQAFQLFFYPELSPIGLERQKNELTTFYKSGKIKLGGLLLLGFTFVVLIVNFLFWSKFSEEKKDLENQMVFNRGMVTDRDSLVSKISRNEQQLKNLGILPYSHQQLFYEIGNAVPTGIKLTSMSINPELEHKGEYGKVVIKGELQDVNAYEKFKKNLVQSKFHLDIEKEELSYNENKKVTVFEMRILLF